MPAVKISRRFFVSYLLCVLTFLSNSAESSYTLQSILMPDTGVRLTFRKVALIPWNKRTEMPGLLLIENVGNL